MLVRNRRTGLTILALLLLLSGCAPSSARTEPPGTLSAEGEAGLQAPVDAGGPGSSEPRRDGAGGQQDGTAVKLPEGCVDRSDLLPRATLLDQAFPGFQSQAVVAGTCRLAIHSEELTVYLILPPDADPAAAEAALQYTGEVKPEVAVMPSVSEHVLAVRFPAGSPGERLTFRLAGPFGPEGRQADLGFELERVTTPRVAMDYRYDGGEWLPFEPGSTLPARPVELRFRPVGGADPGQIADRLTAHGLAVEKQADALTARLAEPPPYLALDLNGIPADHGLLTTRSLLELFTGEAPRAVLLNPATGEEQDLGAAPVHVYSTRLAPSGDWAALVATHPADVTGTEVWALNTRSGELHRTGIAFTSLWYQLHWGPDELVAAAQNRIYHWRAGMTRAAIAQTRGDSFTALSPDGRFLAGITYDMRAEDEHWLAPAGIVLHDLEGGTERVLAEGQVRVRIPHSEAPVQLQLAFTPDGEGLLIREPLPEFGSWRYLRLDLASGALEEVPEPAAETPEEWVAGPHGFAYRPTEDIYGDVVVRGPDGTERHYGSAHVAGWLPDGRLLLIRWENARWLRTPWVV